MKPVTVPTMRTVAPLFRSVAVKSNAAAMVAVHNHPSGDPTPSAADISMTKSLFEAAKLMDIDLLDHLVIGGGKFISLKSTGLGFPNGKAP